MLKAWVNDILILHHTFFIPFSTSFSHPSTTRSRSSAGCSRWHTAWSSGDPKSCLEHSPRTNWQSSRRRSQPKSIMGTGKRGMTFHWELGKRWAYSFKGPSSARAFDLGVAKEYCLLFSFCLGKHLILLKKIGSALHGPAPVLGLWCKGGDGGAGMMALELSGSSTKPTEQMRQTFLGTETVSAHIFTRDFKSLSDSVSLPLPLTGT